MAQLQTADLTSLPEGRRIRTLLLHVWSDSARADDAYVSWAQDQAGCAGRASNDAAKRRGDVFSVLATAAKKAFLLEWNPLASRYGLPKRNFAQI